MTELRPATAHDEATVLQLMADFYAIDHYPFHREKACGIFHKLIANESLGRLWLIMNGAEVAGYACLTFGFSFEYGGRNAFIDELYLKPEYRNRGIGKIVLDLVEVQAIVLGVQTLHLEVEQHNESGQRLYSGRGFKNSGRHLYVKRLSGG